MSNFNLILFFMILLFMVTIEFILRTDVNQAKLLSLNFFMLQFTIFSYIFVKMDLTFNEFHSVELKLSRIWNITMTYGLDSISILFLLLVPFMFTMVTMVAWNSMKANMKNFFVLLMILEFFMLNVFVSFDLLFFYFWFESSLLPMFFMILIWGNNNSSIAAAFYLLMYTLVFSTLFFLAMIIMQVKMQTTNIYLLSNFIVLSPGYQFFFFMAFMLAFMVKLPIFPMHLWLPEAHVEAPTAGPMILASLLLKLGFYGIMRFILQMFPLAVLYFKPLIATMCVMSSTYTALIALSQFDLKKMIAYSSVSHMSLTLLGIFSGNFYGILGGLLLAIGHTFVSAALFMLVGFIYDSYHTRMIDYYSGLGNVLPMYSAVFFMFLMSNFGFPMSLNFVGEFLILVGVGKWNFYMLMSLLLYSVMSVAYNLFLYVRMFHGSRSKIKVFDLSKIEFFSMLPLIMANFWFFMKTNGLMKFVTFFVLNISAMQTLN